MAAPTSSRPVVAGVDGSELALRAARVGAAEARQRNAPLRLVSVLDSPWAGTDPPSAAGSDLASILAAQHQEVLGAVAAELAADTGVRDITTAVVPGHPAEVLRGESA